MKVLAIVFDPQLKALVSQTVKEDSLHWLESEEKFYEEYEKYADGEFGAVICEVRGTGFANEAGQVIRNQCPRTPSFACTVDKALFDPKLLKKNGYTETFLFPVDRESFAEQLSAAMSPEALAKRALKRVLIPDLQANSKPSFTTYVHLPLNNKYLVYSAKGDAFSEKKVEKLKKNHVGSLFIDQKESNAFFEYVAEQMKAGDNTLSATERQEKLKDAVRGIFREVFNSSSEDSFDSGRELLDSCRKMVSSYITTGDGGGDFHTRLLRVVGGTGLDYTHSADVSTLAALFGMAVGSTQIEFLAIAGFLHDISLAQFPEDHGFEVNPAWSEDLKKEFLGHPLQSLNLIKAKKMIVPPEVEKIIMQHHERFDGRGFPKGLNADRICDEAQILSLADQFHYLTIARPGEQRMEAADAIAAIGANGSIAPSLIQKVQAVIGKKPQAA